MLVQRIALLAERLGIPLPRIVGQTRLGLAGTIRVLAPIPVTCSQRVVERISELDQTLNFESAIEELNRRDVWTWFQAKSFRRMCANSWAIRASNSLGAMFAMRLSGSNKTGCNHPITAGTSP